MKIMDMSNLNAAVARLDGFICGVAALQGGVREYTAYSYVIEMEGSISVDDALRRYFSWDPLMGFSPPCALEHGLRDLEILMRPFLVRCEADADGVNDLRRFLSFRVMEMISAVIEGLRVLDVVRLNSVPNEPGSHCSFFCVCVDGAALVLQFNNDSAFLSR